MLCSVTCTRFPARVRCTQSTDVDWECLRKKEPSAFVSPKSYQFLVAGPSFSSFYLPRKQGTFDVGGRLAESKEVLIGFMAEEGTFEASGPTFPVHSVMPERSPAVFGPDAITPKCLSPLPA